MKDIRKKFYKRIIIELLVFFLGWLIISIGYDLIKGKEFTVTPYNFDEVEKLGLTNENLQYEIINDGVIEVKRAWIEEGKLYYTIKGLKKGTAFVCLKDVNDESGVKLTRGDEFSVSSFKAVTDMSTGNYSNYRFHLAMNTTLLIGLAVIGLYNLIKYGRQLKYSYEMMFIAGFSIWLICTIISQIYADINFGIVYKYYMVLREAGYRFALYTLPIILVFCISLSISNISLIRHEGFKKNNLLGIFLSLVLFFGSLTAIAVPNIEITARGSLGHGLNILVMTITSAYSILAALLEGAIIGGILAAKNRPPMDMDYVIILGCMIRKDGSLTPLLRGRVDRAIEHGRQQEKTSGKKLIYVPSGGQGKNEVMAEGQAMKNYLLSQGINEEQILVEDQSTNTYQNMKFSKELIDKQMPDAKIAFSTTNYHVFRSGIIASQNDLVVEGMGGKTKWYFWPNAFIREFLGMLVYTKRTIACILLLLIAAFSSLEMIVFKNIIL